MCGRYVSTRSPQDLTRLFDVADWRAEETLAPNWNVAPTDDVYAVLERAPREDVDEGSVRRELRPLRWGLVPSWAKDPKIGSRMINARVETVHERPAYRRAFARRRTGRRLADQPGVRRVGSSPSTAEPALPVVRLLTWLVIETDLLAFTHWAPKPSC